MRWTCQGGRTTGPNVLDEGSSVVRRQSFPRHPKRAEAEVRGGGGAGRKGPGHRAARALEARAAGPRAEASRLAAGLGSGTR